MKQLIVVDYASLTPGVREYVIEFMVGHPAAELCILSSAAGLSYADAKQAVESLLMPYDALITNQRKAGKTVPGLTFKTMVLAAMQDHYELVLVVDMDQEALDMYGSVGAKLVYNPLTTGESFGVQ